MKKIMTLVMFVGMIIVSGCSGSDGAPGFDGQDGLDGLNGLDSEVFQLNNFDFVKDPVVGYTIYQKFTPVILSSENILIYRKSGTTVSNEPIWRLIPNTINATQGEVKYDFDFSKEDFSIYVRATYDLALTPTYINNQTFRVVIIPGTMSTTIDKNNYLDVVSSLNINESQVRAINF